MKMIKFQFSTSNKITNPNFQTKKGFTLIELLVVIAIIGILSTLLLANFNAARERARDAQRKSDIDQIRKALELYKNDQSPLTYPLDASVSCGSALTIYMAKIPCDPLDGSTGATKYKYTLGVDTLTYTIIACLENAADPSKDSAPDAYCGGSRYSYTRTQP